MAYPPMYGHREGPYDHPPAQSYGAPVAYGHHPAPGDYGAPAYGAAAQALGYGAPAPSYGAAPAYGSPAPGYSIAPAPMQGYGAAPAYGSAAPAPGYGSPAPGHSAVPAYGAAPGYGAAPAPGYGAPTPSYGSYAPAPAPGYGPQDPYAHVPLRPQPVGRGPKKVVKLIGRASLKSKSGQAESKGKKKGKGKGKGGESQIQGVSPDANVYVYGMPVTWTEQKMQKQFSQFGKIVSVKIVTDSEGTSKGFGFVGYEKAPNAQKAILSMDGKQIGDCRLIVRLKGSDSDGKGAGKAKGPKERAPAGSTAYIYSVPPEWTEKDLHRNFAHCGEIASCKMGRGPEGNSKGFGFVDFVCGPIGVLKAMLSMDNYNASPRHAIVVNPKKGDEELIPPVPKLDFPPPANPFNGPVHWVKEEPGSTIFVFHLPSDWSDIELFITFIHLGDIINAKVQAQEGAKGAWQSRGFGFVTFASKVSAVRAIKAMNGFDTGAKHPLQVSIKKGDEEHVESMLKELASIPDFVHSEASKKGANKNGLNHQVIGDVTKVPPGGNVFVRNMPASWTGIELREEFGQFGAIACLKVARNDDGASRCFGFVGFEKAESAKEAINDINGKKVGDCVLSVQLKDNKAKAW